MRLRSLCFAASLLVSSGAAARKHEPSPEPKLHLVERVELTVHGATVTLARMIEVETGYTPWSAA